MPTIFLYMIFMTLPILPWYTGMILAMAEFFGMHHIVTRVLLNKPTYTESVTASPYFSGILFGSRETNTLHVETDSHGFAHLIFALSFGLCAYNFFRAMTLDPGTCLTPKSDAELKSIIEDLASEGRLNGQTFCIQCMARKPLRSKHCPIAHEFGIAVGSCVQLLDPELTPFPVGVNNHRQFIIFVTTLVIGIILFDSLAWAFELLLDRKSPKPSACLPPACLRNLTATDMFLFSVAAWSTLQLIWTVVLLVSQYLQTARQMTTLELVGFDRFTSGKAANGLERAGHATNPFNVGVVGNCRDFWTRGRELGVEYDRLYEIPVEGFQEARRGREREQAEEAGVGRKGHGLRQKLMLGLGIGGASARAAHGGYEPVSQV
ncbi:hypothetical protein EI94DRAFT_1795860 [Lactarius quietus]|nr:hypothetical protein EI94DRAFT_1795860 [Lactarius quietus]